MMYEILLKIDGKMLILQGGKYFAYDGKYKDELICRGDNWEWRDVKDRDEAVCAFKRYCTDCRSAAGYFNII